MKALVRQERVLLYHLEETGERGGQVRQLLQKEGVPYREIQETMLGETLGYCAGETGYSSSGQDYHGPVFSEEVMVFYGISGKRLDCLLRALKTLPAGPVELKAVVTQHNKSWTVADLFEELKKEHLLMAKMNQVRAEISRWTEKDLSAAAQKDQTELIVAIQKARTMLKKGEEVTEALCDQAIQEIRAAGERCVCKEKNLEEKAEASGRE